MCNFLASILNYKSWCRLMCVNSMMYYHIIFELALIFAHVFTYTTYWAQETTCIKWCRLFMSWIGKVNLNVFRKSLHLFHTTNACQMFFIYFLYNESSPISIPIILLHYKFFWTLTTRYLSNLKFLLQLNFWWIKA